MYSYMTRSEFIARAKQWRNQAMWNALLAMLVGVLTFAGFWYLVRRLELSGGESLGLLLAMILVPAFVIGSRSTRATRELGLLCPNCRKPLVTLGTADAGGTFGRNAYEVTVTTGRCGRCGSRVLQDEEHSHS